MSHDNTLQTYTPGSDIAIAFQPNQIVWGRTGNDIIMGYNVANPVFGQATLDIMVGDIEIPLLVDPEPRDWKNKFVLGDARKSFYGNGNPFLLGLNDFAIIIDFDTARDTLQLHGRSQDYELINFGLGTAIVQKQQLAPGLVVPDVVAILPVTGLNLQDSYFKFMGYQPPPPTLPKAKQIGTSSFEMGNSITVDRQGYVYVAGGTSGDVGGPNQGNRDIWFAKYDRHGNEVWRQQIGSDSFDFPFGIGVDARGNVYLAGSTQGNLDVLTGDVLSDGWLAKFDSQGNPLWTRQFGSEGYYAHNVYAIDVDARGNVSISGVSVKATPEGAPLPTTADTWVARYDTNGKQQWFQQFGTPNDDVAFDESYAISVDRQRNAYTAGFTTGPLGNSYGGLYDAWVAKHDRHGNQVWAKNIGSADYDWAWGVDTDSRGNVYVTGWTLGNLGGTKLGSFDAWLAKFDRHGNQKWIKQIGTSGDDQAFGVKVDSRDNVYVTGYTDGDFGGTNQGEYDAWVAKFDGQGNRKWVQQFGSAGTEQAYDITVADNDYVYVTGITDGSLGTTNQGSFDGWVVKLSARNGAVQNFTGTGQRRHNHRPRGLNLNLDRPGGQQINPATPTTTPTSPTNPSPPSGVIDPVALQRSIEERLQGLLGSGNGPTIDLTNLPSLLANSGYGGTGTNTVNVNSLRDPLAPPAAIVPVLLANTNQPVPLPT